MGRPLPEESRPRFLEALIADAVSRGATIVNAASGGGQLAGALMTPAVIDGVTRDLRLFHEEQVCVCSCVCVRVCARVRV